jgi:hypothetical protein
MGVFNHRITFTNFGIRRVLGKTNIFNGLFVPISLSSITSAGGGEGDDYWRDPGLGHQSPIDVKLPSAAIAGW